MRTAALALAALLILAHPAVAVAVIGAELAACGVLAVVIVRALQPLSVPHRQRRTA